LIRLLVLSVALLLAACAGRNARFTDRDALERIAARPLAPVAKKEVARGPPQWQLQGPFPDQVAPAASAPATIWESAVAARLPPDGRVRMSPDLHCVAREYGLYLQAHGAYPQPELSRYVGGRCGSAAWLSSTYTLRGEVGAEEDEAALLERWKDSIGQRVADVLQSHPDGVGVWAGRQGDQVLLMIVSSRSLAKLEPLPAVGGEGARYVLRGELREEAGQVFALITRGEWDFAQCVRIAGVELPRYEFLCEADPSDEEAWIEINSVRPGRLLARSVLEVLVTPSGATGGRYRRAGFGSDPGPGLPDESRLTRMVNEVRARAGRRPVELSLGQSHTVKRVAPHFFAASAGEDKERLADTIALGLIAGWDVESERVRDGTFTVGRISGEGTLPELVGQMLARANGRRALLHEDTRTLAIGLDENQDGTAAMVCTYRMLEPRPMNEEAAQVIAALNAARAAIGLPPAVWVAPPEGSTDEALDLLKKGADPRRATGAVVQRVMDITQAAMTGWTLVTPALEELQFPPELVRAPKLAVVIAVGHQRVRGDPWASYVVMLVLPDMADVRENSTVVENLPTGGRPVAVRVVQAPLWPR
jgi:hypothetical protein